MFPACTCDSPERQVHVLDPGNEGWRNMADANQKAADKRHPAERETPTEKVGYRTCKKTDCSRTRAC